MNDRMHPPHKVRNWMERILGVEQGYSDDPTDPGNWTGGKPGKGRLVGTKFGIAANTYGDGPEVPGKGFVPIINLTAEDAVAVFRRDFLDPLRADRYEDGVAFQLLDFAINSGPFQAIQSLQRAIGAAPDGIVGRETRGRLDQYSEAQLIMLVVAERLDFMTRLPNWPDHGRGWARRLATKLRYGAEDIV